jgi:hypothetical protein
MTGESCCERLRDRAREAAVISAVLLGSAELSFFVLESLSSQATANTRLATNSERIGKVLLIKISVSITCDRRPKQGRVSLSDKCETADIAAYFVGELRNVIEDKVAAASIPL